MLGLAVFVAASCGSSGSSGDDDTNATSDDDDNDDGSPSGTVHEVSIIDYAFEPKTIDIAVGDTVKWTNNGQMHHHVESGNPGDANAGSVFDSGALNPGMTFSFTFTAAGDYPYFCAFHPTLMFDDHVIVQ
jgi:plastocyanin